MTSRERAQGPQHPDTATPLDHLAAFYHAQGQYALAEPVYQRVLNIREQALGPQHPDTAATRAHLTQTHDGLAR